MDKLAKRSALAANQAKRKARSILASDRKRDEQAARREQFAYQRRVLDHAKQTRQMRREDWLRGPLAPRRDVGEAAGLYGTLPMEIYYPPKIAESKRRKFINVTIGDRVCIMKGRDKGIITKVTDVNAESETLTVEGFNVYDVAVPKYARMEGDDDHRPYRRYARPLPIDDVRLVAPLTDQATGITKDVIVKHLYGGEPFLEQPYGSPTPLHTRYIAGLDIEIPWPPAPVEEFQQHELDTPQELVEEQTYTHSLLTYPMPESVIDELRNKYSKFRTRHDTEYVAKKLKEAAWEEWRKSRRLLTPLAEARVQLDEYRAREREAMKEPDGSYKLSDETQTFIAQFLKAKREQQSAQSGRTA